MWREVGGPHPQVSTTPLTSVRKQLRTAQGVGRSTLFPSPYKCTVSNLHITAPISPLRGTPPSQPTTWSTKGIPQGLPQFIVFKGKENFERSLIHLSFSFFLLFEEKQKCKYSLSYSLKFCSEITRPGVVWELKDKRLGKRTWKKTTQHIPLENTNRPSSCFTESDQIDGLQANIMTRVAQGAKKGKHWWLYSATATLGIISLAPQDNSTWWVLLLPSILQMKAQRLGS